jgi:hypothetical protein
MMETAHEFLERKGITKVYQPSRRYNLSIAELVEFLDEYATKSLKEFLVRKNEQKRPTVPEYYKSEETGLSRVSS